MAVIVAMVAQTTINKTAAAGDNDGSDDGGSGRDDGDGGMISNCPRSPNLWP